MHRYLGPFRLTEKLPVLRYWQFFEKRRLGILRQNKQNMAYYKVVYYFFLLKIPE